MISAIIIEDEFNAARFLMTTLRDIAPDIEVQAVLGEVGINLSGARPQRLTDELAQSAHWLITMGCGEACPHVPGLRRDDWPLEDPKGKPLERVRQIRDEVRARVAQLLAREGWSPGGF